MELILLPVVVAYVAVAGLAWIVGRFIRYSTVRQIRRKRLADQTVIAEYVAPPNLRPAEVGYLYDQMAGEAEYMATVFDLEQRGYLVLGADNERRSFRAHATNKSIGDLEPFEAEVYANAQRAVSRRGRWFEYAWGNRFDTLLTRAAEDKGFIKPPRHAAALRISNIGILLAVLGTSWGLFVLRFGNSIDSYAELSDLMTALLIVLMMTIVGLLLAPVLRMGFVVYVRAKSFADATKSLDALWSQLEGYRQFIELVEFDKIRFSNETQREKARHEVLPYAVSLGLDTHWQERFRAS